MKLPYKSNLLEQTEIINHNYSFFFLIHAFFSVCIDNDWLTVFESLCNTERHSCSVRQRLFTPLNNKIKGEVCSFSELQQPC